MESCVKATPGMPFGRPWLKADYSTSFRSWLPFCGITTRNRHSSNWLCGEAVHAPIAAYLSTRNQVTHANGVATGCAVNARGRVAAAKIRIARAVLAPARIAKSLIAALV